MEDLFSFPMVLGSWQTLETLDAEAGHQLIAEAHRAGIRHYDVARYTPDNGGVSGDETATERAFARFSEGLDLMVAGKVWFDRWPEVRPLAEVEASLERLGRDHLDLVYLEEPRGEGAGVAVSDAIEGLAEVMDSGRARAWGLGSWGPEAVQQALDEAERRGLAGPAAFQVPYSVVWRGALDALEAVLASHPVPVVASAPLAYGLLTGKYRHGSSGRMAAAWGGAEAVRAVVGAYLEVADEVGIDPAQLAIAYNLAHPRVSAVVFGARTVDQLTHNLGALDVDVEDGLWQRLAALPTLGP